MILSVRSPYEDYVVPDQIKDQAAIVTHEGFASIEFEATRTFFDHYGIEFPSAPLLQPEFRNPLLLKTLCQSLQRVGKRTLQGDLAVLLQSSIPTFRRLTPPSPTDWTMIAATISFARLLSRLYTALRGKV